MFGVLSRTVIAITMYFIGLYHFYEAIVAFYVDCFTHALDNIFDIDVFEVLFHVEKCKPG